MATDIFIDELIYFIHPQGYKRCFISDTKYLKTHGIKIGNGINMGKSVMIGNNVTIGKNVTIGNNVTIFYGAKVKSNTLIYPNSNFI